MLFIITLALLMGILLIILQKSLDTLLTSQRQAIDVKLNEAKELEVTNNYLNSDNASHEQAVTETIALYDVTKDISKSLDPDIIFEKFRNHLSRYLQVKDCQFIKDESGLSAYRDYTIMPLILQNTDVGYLVVSKLAPNDAEKFQILAQQFVGSLKRALLYQKVQELTITDGLTQVLSRRYFVEKFGEEIQRASKFDRSFSILMVDVDRFKDLNDRYGHLVGDVVLREVAQVLKEGIRQIDFVGRMGGEELAIVLPDTDKAHATYVAERIRRAVELRLISAYDEQIHTTVSIGVAGFPMDARELLPLLEKADEALYQAKNSGRNKVAVR